MKLNVAGGRVVVVAVAVLALIAAVACGGGEADSSGAAKSPTRAGGAAKATPTPVHTDHAAEIDQKNMAFIPTRITVKTGETVLIKNSEAAIHTANLNGENVTGNMKNGDSTAWVAEAPGAYRVTCEYHPQMRATIIVTE